MIMVDKNIYKLKINKQYLIKKQNRKKLNLIINNNNSFKMKKLFNNKK